MNNRNTFDAYELMHAAMRKSRRTHFRDTSFVDPLRRLLRAYDEEADLGLFGRLAVRFDVLRCLGNLLRLEQEEEAAPAIVTRRIPHPLFITGLPRSSTTFLHMLLAQDPANVVPRSWQLIYPYPRRSRLFCADLRRRHVQLQFGIFQVLSPAMEDLHPLSADAPQECTDITAQVFQSMRFDSTHRIPSYRRWLDAHGHLDAYRFHRRFLQHLNASGRRWVLKSPDHVFALDAIAAVYPDAQLVFLHRDPLSVIASQLKLSETLRRPFTRNLDLNEIGQQVGSSLIDGTDRMAEAAMRSDRILHLHFKEVIAAPMQAVERIYRHGGRTLSPEAERRMQGWLRRRAGQSHPHRRYSLTEFGLDAGLLRERFRSYVEYFGVAPEWKEHAA